MKIVVLGLGYLGATHAACMAELGHEVLGVETDPRKCQLLASGKLPFFEKGLSELVVEHLESGRLQITASYDAAAAWGEVFFIAVGTPQLKGEFAADLSYVESVIDTLVPRLAHDSVIFGKSTVPVGTCYALQERADRLAPKHISVELAWNPEFLREGHAIEDTLTPDRLVLGATSGGRAEAICRAVYQQPISQGSPLIVMDIASAELVKVAANSFLATKLSFINAIAEVCEATGADVSAVADAVGRDHRIGTSYFRAGIGFGGGCLPKDIRAFMARSAELGTVGIQMLLREVDQINLRRRNRMVDLAKSLCSGSLLSARIAVLGTAFKANSDDVRDSPALNIAGQLQLQGADVRVYDPKAIENSRHVFPTLGYVGTAEEACTGADIAMVLTEWQEFVDLDPAQVARVARGRTIVDGRHCLDADKWRAAGWTYLS